VEDGSSRAAKKTPNGIRSIDRQKRYLHGGRFNRSTTWVFVKYLGRFSDTENRNFQIWLSHHYAKTYRVSFTNQNGRATGITERESQNENHRFEYVSFFM